MQLNEVFLTPRYLGIAMEYAAGGDMFESFANYKVFSGGLTEDLARWFFQQLIIALDFTHKKGVANRDIKLEVRCLPCHLAVAVLIWRTGGWLSGGRPGEWAGL